MGKSSKHLETTRSQVLPGNSTLIETPAGGTRSAEGVGRRQLRTNFEALIREQAIYYPVAYRFQRELGRGRQGIVYLGQRHGSRGCVTQHAIKVFDPGIYSSAKKYWTDMGRLAAQISKLQAVQSPNLVDRDIYEETNGIGYIQMNVVDGLDLATFLSGRHLARVRLTTNDEEWLRLTDSIFRTEEGKVTIQPGVALYILRQALLGLETLHNAGFVHSDVKPGNIMLDRLGYVKLIDFGRAVTVNEPVSILLGSPLYMAPETHRREPSRIQSDIYSVGLVGVEMLRGEPLVDTEGMTERDLLSFKEELPDRLHEILPQHVVENPELVDILRRFLQNNPDDRFSTAEEAESGHTGLRLVHQQLTHLGKDSEYRRDISRYMDKACPTSGAPVSTGSTR